MERKLFRSKSIEQVSSPEQLNDYIRVTSPGVWLMMAALICLLLGICVWGIFGKLDTVLPVCAVTTQEQTVCYIKEADRGSVSAGMPVSINGVSCTVLEIAGQPVPADEGFSDYLLHVGELSRGEWVYPAVLSRTVGSSGEIFGAQILIESIAPMTFLTN